MSEPGSQLYDALALLLDGPVVPPVGLGQRAARRQRRRRRLFIVGAAVGAIALTVPLALVGHNSGAHVTPADNTNNPKATAEALSKGHWSVLPNAPIALRTEPAVVWTGTQMLIWGGRDTSDHALNDGAAFNPGSQTWSVLPTSPLSARDEAAAVWTGKEMIVWGGRQDGPLGDGAAYDPATKTWRTLPPAPQSPRSGATAILSGREVVVVGGYGRHTAVDNAAYDPTTNRWHTLPGLPARPEHTYTATQVEAVAFGSQVLIEASWTYNKTIGPGESVGSFGVDSFLLDPAHGSLHQQATEPLAPRGHGALLWTGTQILSAAAPTDFPHGGPMEGNLRGQRYDPVTGHWSAISHGPVDDLRGKSLWTGAALLTFDTGTFTGGTASTTHLPGEAAAWDPASDQWSSIPSAPAQGASAAIWTGTELIEWGNLYTTALTTPSTGDEKSVHSPHQTLAFTIGQ